MQGIDRPGLAILASALFTALIQSSAATTGIVIVLASQGFVTLDAGIALALGANIGTCVTALLAAVGKPRPALQAALVHVLFNVAGVLLWVWFIPDLAEIVRRISPTSPALQGAARMAAEVPRQIANAHTVFNVANTGLFLPFTGAAAGLVRRLLPERVEVIERAQPRFLDDVYLETPALAIDRLRLEVGHLGGVALAVEKELASLPVEREGLEAAVADARALYAAVVDYARRLLQRETSSRETAEIERVLTAANHFLSVADTIADSLGAVLSEARRRQLTASPETRRMIETLMERVGVALEQAAGAVAERDPTRAAAVIALETDIDEQAAALEHRLSSRLTADDTDRLALYRLESEVIEILKRLYYFAARVARIAAVDARGAGASTSPEPPAAAA